MNVNKESLLYRLFTIYAFNASKNSRMDKFTLCYYFWQIMSSFITFSGLVFIGVILSMMILEPIITLFIYLFTDQFYMFFGGDEPFFLILGIFLYLVLIGIGISIAIEERKIYLQNKKLIEEKMDKNEDENSFRYLIKSYYRAVKEKVCPIIEVK